MRYLLVFVSLVVAACGKDEVESLRTELSACNSDRRELVDKKAAAEERMAALESKLAEAASAMDAGGSTEPEPAKPYPLWDVTWSAPKPAMRYDASMFEKPSRVFLASSGDDELLVEVTSIDWKKKRWVSDRTSYESTFRDAPKGQVFVVLDFDVTTKASNPKIPAFYVMSLVGGLPVLADHLQRPSVPFFYRWSSYGASLGNHHDFKNDFKYAETVKFTAGLIVDESRLEDGLFLVSTKNACAPRTGDAEVPYAPFYCPGGVIAEAKSPDLFWAAHHLVAVKNPKKLVFD